METKRTAATRRRGMSPTDPARRVDPSSKTEQWHELSRLKRIFFNGGLNKVNVAVTRGMTQGTKSDRVGG